MIIRCLSFSLFLVFGTLCSAFAETSPIRLAGVFVLSGHAADEDAANVRGARLAVRMLNESGGLLGRPVSIDMYDNQSAPSVAYAVTVKACESGGAAVIGPGWSSHALAAAKAARQFGVPLIATTASHPDLTSIGPNIFRVCATNDLYGAVLGHFVYNDLKAKTAAIFIKKASSYSVSLAEEFRKEFECLQGKIIQETHYSEYQESLHSDLEKTKALSPDILFIAGHGESAKIINKARKLGIRAPAVGGDGWADAGFRLSLTEDKGYYIDNVPEEIVGKELAKLQKYSEEPIVLSSAVILSYEAVMVFADAVKRAGSVDAPAVLAAMKKTTSFKGLAGNIAFDDVGNAKRDIHIVSIQGKEHKHLKTYDKGLRPCAQ